VKTLLMNVRKIFVTVLIPLALCGFFAACGEDDNNGNSSSSASSSEDGNNASSSSSLSVPAGSFLVTFDSTGGSDVNPQILAEGAHVSEPPDPGKGAPADLYLPAGLYLGTPPAYTFDGWYNGNTAWDFAVNTVTTNITLTAQWTEPTPIQGISPADLAAVVYYVNGNSDYGVSFTLVLDQSIQATLPQALYATDAALAIIGNVPGCAITYIGAVDQPLFTIKDNEHPGTEVIDSPANPVLILGNNIVLNGIGDGSAAAPLIHVEYGKLVMLAGSKITGHRTSADAGAVYVKDGIFEMTGGEITGNRSTGNLGDAAGGVYVSSGQFTMTGDSSVTLNTAAFTADSLDDVFIYGTGGNEFKLSGDATVGALTLLGDTAYSFVTLVGAYSGSVTLNLLALADDIDEVVSYWANKNVIQGDSVWITAAVSKITLGDFRLWGGEEWEEDEEFFIRPISPTHEISASGQLVSKN